MKRIAMLAGAALMGAMGSMGNLIPLEPAPTVRSPGQPNKRVSKSGKRRIGRSKYMPHQGAKERERAARSYMQRFFPIAGPIQTDPIRLRSAPIVQVISKRDYYAGPF